MQRALITHDIGDKIQDLIRHKHIGLGEFWLWVASVGSQVTKGAQKKQTYKWQPHSPA